MLRGLFKQAAEAVAEAAAEAAAEVAAVGNVGSGCSGGTAISAALARQP